MNVNPAFGEDRYNYKNIQRLIKMSPLQPNVPEIGIWQNTCLERPDMLESVDSLDGSYPCVVGLNSGDNYFLGKFY